MLTTTRHFQFREEGKFCLGSNNDSNSFSDLPPERYSVHEVPVRGWRLESIECESQLGTAVINVSDSGSPAGGFVSITLAAGDRVVCTFTNVPVFAECHLSVVVNTFRVRFKSDSVGSTWNLKLRARFFPVSRLTLKAEEGQTLTLGHTVGSRILPGSLFPTDIDFDAEVRNSGVSGRNKQSVFLECGDEATRTLTVLVVEETFLGPADVFEVEINYTIRTEGIE